MDILGAFRGTIKNLTTYWKAQQGDLEWLVKNLGHGPYATSDGTQSLSPLHHEIISRIHRRVTHSDLPTGDRVYHMEVYHPNVKDLDGLTILYLADTHFVDTKRSRRKFDAYDFLRHRPFDIVVHAGDIIDASASQMMDHHYLFLSGIKGKLGKYFVLGNHDYNDGDRIPALTGRMEEAGFVNITNASHQLEYNGKKLFLIGLDDPLLGKPNPARAFENVEDDSFNILVVHSLDGLTSHVPELADLVLSGHVHAGELNFKVINGYHYLAMLGYYHNLNHQQRGFKFLTPRTLSYIHPGVYSHARDGTFIPRIGTDKQGIVILKLNKC